jgi:L-alanine-DL-glutamate epimerase-like enolase superfamily enzyme
MSHAIRELSFRKVVRPLRAVFATSLGSKTCATSVLLRVRLQGGQCGVGEVPTSFVMPHETADAISAILREARGELLGTPIADYAPLLARLRRRHSAFHMTLAGLEVALFRTHLAAQGRRELAHWGARRGMITTDITISFAPGGEGLAAALGRARRGGFDVLKVKVSGDVAADLAFVEAVRAGTAAWSRPPRLRLDGNQGYTARSLLRMLAALERRRIDIELFEQPLRRDDYRGLAHIRPRSSVPVIVDETVFCGDDCRRVIDNALAHGINIKVAKSGIAESAVIMKLARRAGLKLMIGCMTETMVGLSAGIRMAAGTGAFDYIDLDSVHLMRSRRRYEDIAIDGPTYVLEGGSC